MDSEHNQLMQDLSGMAPEYVDAVKPSIFDVPTFEFEVKTKLKIESAKAMDGKVTMRFPTVEDELAIERKTRGLGNGTVAHMLATLSTCITAAPASWYELQKDATKPTLALPNLIDGVVLGELYLAFVQWQRSFR